MRKYNKNPGIMLKHTGSHDEFLKRAPMVIGKNPKQDYALIYIDILQFKYINNRFGHEAGDKLLQLVGAALKRFIRGKEMFARVYADHFIALVKYDNQETLKNRLSTLENDLSGIADGAYSFLFRAGIYIIKEDCSIKDAIDNANYAKSTVKREICRNSYAYYTDSMVEEIKKEKELEALMGTAIKGKKFAPFLQPKVDINTKRVIGAEALVRWNDFKRRNVMPNDFIPFFERNGFIVNIDFYIYEEICRLIRKWLDEGTPVVPISCNFSKLHIRNHDFPERVNQIAEKYKLPREYITLEFTETIPVENWDLFIKATQELKKYGFVIGLDDFGKDYCSLAMITKMPLDVLKLDKIFLKDYMGKKLERDLLKMLIKLCTENNISVICEGVESEDHEKFLKEINCSQAQGYLYGRPVPIEEFEKYYIKRKVV